MVGSVLDVESVVRVNFPRTRADIYIIYEGVWLEAHVRNALPILHYDKCSLPHIIEHRVARSRRIMAWDKA